MAAEHEHEHEHEHGHEREHGRGEGHEHEHGGARLAWDRRDHAHAEPAGPARGDGARRLRIALVLTAAFMVAEAVGGYLANSQALMADAGHMFSDVGALTLSLIAIHFATRPATGRKSYGWLRLEILAALANGVVLVVVALAIFWEAFERMRDPPPVEVPLMLGIAAVGLGANVAAGVILHGAHRENLNVSAAYVHVLGDLLGSVGAVIAGVVMWKTGWYAIDPIIAVIVGLLILVSAAGIVRQATEVLLEGVPSHIDLDALSRELARVEGIRSVHDLHVWTISSGVHLMTCHAVVGGHGDHHEVLDRLSELVRRRFRIEHSTIQLECEDLSPKEVGTAFCDRG